MVSFIAYDVILKFQLSVVINIPMREEDRQTHLVYILKSNFGKSSLESEHQQELVNQMKGYEMYKKNFVRDIVFDPTETGLSMF